MVLPESFLTEMDGCSPSGIEYLPFDMHRVLLPMVVISYITGSGCYRAAVSLETCLATSGETVQRLNAGVAMLECGAWPRSHRTAFATQCILHLVLM